MHPLEAAIPLTARPTRLVDAPNGRVGWISAGRLSGWATIKAAIIVPLAQNLLSYPATANIMICYRFYDRAEGLSVVRVLLGYAGMIISSAATSVAIMAAAVICTANHISIGSLFLAFFNPISILTFIVAATIALIFSSIPFTIFIIIGEIKHIRCLSWYSAAAFATLIIFFSFVVLDKSASNHSHEPILTNIILNFTYVVAQAAVGTFAYWKIAGRFAGIKDEQMYGPF